MLAALILLAYSPVIAVYDYCFFINREEWLDGKGIGTILVFFFQFYLTKCAESRNNLHFARRNILYARG